MMYDIICIKCILDICIHSKTKTFDTGHRLLLQMRVANILWGETSQKCPGSKIWQIWFQPWDMSSSTSNWFHFFAHLPSWIFTHFVRSNNSETQKQGPDSPGTLSLLFQPMHVLRDRYSYIRVRYAHRF